MSTAVDFVSEDTTVKWVRLWWKFHNSTEHTKDSEARLNYMHTHQFSFHVVGSRLVKSTWKAADNCCCLLPEFNYLEFKKDQAVSPDCQSAETMKSSQEKGNMVGEDFVWLVFPLLLFSPISATCTINITEKSYISQCCDIDAFICTQLHILLSAATPFGGNAWKCTASLYSA